MDRNRTGTRESLSTHNLQPPSVHDQWFTDADWCSILPDYWSSLKNYRDQVTTRKFTPAIKKHFGDISGGRGETNPNGVYCVHHGTKTCFLITLKNFCPLSPSSPNFVIGDITKVLKPMQPQYHPVSSRGLAESILKQTYFDSSEAWKQFMPSDVPKPKYTDPTKSTAEEVKAVIKREWRHVKVAYKTFGRQSMVERGMILSMSLISNGGRSH